MRCGVEDAREAGIARRWEGTEGDKCISCLAKKGVMKCVFVHSCERAIPNDERSHFLEGKSGSRWSGSGSIRLGMRVAVHRSHAYAPLMGRHAGRENSSAGDRSQSDRELDLRRARAFRNYSNIIVSAAAKSFAGTTDCSLSGLGSSGESSKTWVGRAAKLRCVKMRISISADSIFGSLGRPSGPKSGLGGIIVSLRR